VAISEILFPIFISIQINKPRRTKIMNHMTINATDPNPALVAANVSPSTLTAQTNLAEDTIIGAAMDIKPGKATSAMFANPLNGGMEEMLYIDENQSLRWIRHSNGTASSPGAQVDAAWVNDTVATGYSSVVVAVHPTGVVWAFANTEFSGNIDMYQLVANAEASAGGVWVKFTGEGLAAALPSAYAYGNLSVQYLNDRPATPLVFFTATDGVQGVLACLAPQLPVVSNPRFWRAAQPAHVSAADINASCCLGKSEIDGSYYLYTLDDGQLTLTIANNTDVKRIPCGIPVYTSMLGICTTDNGPSCLVAGPGVGSSSAIYFFYPTLRDSAPTAEFSSVSMDQPLDDAAVWQDAETLLHVYGRGKNGGLYVIHQNAWLRTLGTWSGQPSKFTPVWDQHTRPADGVSLATSRALIANVASYNLDAFPDDTPNQHAMLSGVAPGEMCAFYKQNVAGTYWAKEQVRIVAEKLPAPYKVKRYQIVVTAKTGMGSPASGLKLSLTASAPTDLQVNGMFYRPGPNTPIHITTDSSGKAILRIMAEGLHQPSIHISAAGMAGNLSVNPTSGVQKFVSGVGGLPNHPDGFNAKFVEDAKNPDGSELFPGIDRKSKGQKKATQWPPTADDLVDFCKSAFAVQSDTSVTVDDPAKPGSKIDVLAFSLQMHDATRAGYEVHVSSAVVAAHHQRLAAFNYGDSTGDFFADLTQGIRSGLVEVKEVFVDVKNRIVKTLVTLADGLQALYEHALEFVHEAAQAVESVIVAVGAKIHEFINYLSWLFEFKDVWDTMTAMESGFKLALPFATRSMQEFQTSIDHFLDEQIANIDSTFEHLKASLTNQTFAPDQNAEQGANSDGAVKSNVGKEALGGGHAHWLSDHMSQAAKGANFHRPQKLLFKKMKSDDPLADLIKSIEESPGLDDLKKMVDDFGTLALSIFSVANPATVTSTPMIALLDICKDLVEALLKFVRSIVDGIFTVGFSVIDSLDDYFNTPVDVPLLSVLYEFVQREAGVSPQPLTFGRLGLLFIAFPTTIALKVITGEAPFPGGNLPNIYEKEPQVDSRARPAGSGTIEPPFWDIRFRISYAFAAVQLVSIEKELFSDWMATKTEKEIEEYEWLMRIHSRLWSGIDFFFWIALQCPAIWGVPAAWESGYNARAQTIWGNWLMGILANGIDIANAWKYGRMTGMTGDYIQQLLTIAGVTVEIIQFVLRFARYRVSPNNGTTSGIMILAGNMCDSLVGISCLMRLVNPENPATKNQVLAVKAGIDVLGPAAAAFITCVRYTMQKGPKIINPPDQLPNGAIGAAYGPVQFQVDGLSPPYKWSAVSAVQPPVSQIILPPGLTIDAKTGLLSGTPEKPGIYKFAIYVEDFFVGPSWAYQSNVYTVEISAAGAKRK
jgi:Putative Ig domain